MEDEGRYNSGDTFPFHGEEHLDAHGSSCRRQPLADVSWHLNNSGSSPWPEKRKTMSIGRFMEGLTEDQTGCLSDALREIKDRGFQCKEVTIERKGPVLQSNKMFASKD
jgi:hypothetical protein